MDCIQRLHYAKLVGITFRRDYGSYRFAPFHWEKLYFYVMAGRMGEIGLLLDGWHGRTGQTWWYRCWMEVPLLSGAGSVARSLDLEVRWVSGSGSCHQFHRCCRGGRVFVSVQPKIIIHSTQILAAIYYNVVQRVQMIQLYCELLQTVWKMKTYQERTYRKIITPKLNILIPT